MRTSLSSLRASPGPGQYKMMRSTFDADADALGESWGSFSFQKQSTYRLNDKLAPERKCKVLVPGPGRYENCLDDLSLGSITMRSS